MAERERPILFSEPMVRAIVGSRKWQTRRVMKPQPKERGGAIFWKSPQYDNGDGVHYFHTRETAGVMQSWLRACPYGIVGDRLWVREKWTPCSGGDPGPGKRGITFCDGGQKFEDGAYYPPQNSYSPGAFDGLKWRPSIHLPRKLSRILLEIVRVRVERVQEITEADAYAEGIAGTLPEDDVDDVVEEFAALWDDINGPRGFGWKKNPWVWVVDFRRVAP